MAVYFLQRMLDNGEKDTEYLSPPWYVSEMNMPAVSPEYVTQPHYNRDGETIEHTQLGRRNWSITIERKCDTRSERRRAMDKLLRFMYAHQDKAPRLVAQYDDERQRAVDIRPDPGISDTFTNDGNFNLSGTIEAMSPSPYFYNPRLRVIPINSQSAGRSSSRRWPLQWTGARYGNESSGFRNEGDVAVYPLIYITGGSFTYAGFTLRPENVLAGAHGRWNYPGAGWHLQIDIGDSAKMRNVRLNSDYEVIEEGPRLRHLHLMESNPRLFELQPRHAGSAANSIARNIRGSASLQATLVFQEQYMSM